MGRGLSLDDVSYIFRKLVQIYLLVRPGVRRKLRLDTVSSEELVCCLLNRRPSVCRGLRHDDVSY